MLPDHAPDAEHAVALLLDHVSIELVPLVIVLGPTLRLTEGAVGVTETVADWDAEPPLPVQVNV